MNLDTNVTTVIGDKYDGDPEKCIRDVIGRWMNDEDELSANYKCTWNGICRQLEDLLFPRQTQSFSVLISPDLFSHFMS